MKLMQWLPQAVASVVAYRYTESSVAALKDGARDLGVLGLTWLVAVLCALVGALFLMGAAFLWLNDRLDTPVAALVMAITLGVLSGILMHYMVSMSRREKKSHFAIGK